MVKDNKQRTCQLKTVNEIEEPDYSQCENCLEEQCPLIDGLC